jgi:hypothetical protein
MKIKDILKLPTIKIGDEILVGKFKNRKATITGFTTDDNNQPVLKTTKGDQKLFKPRIAKLMEAVGGNNLYHFSSVDGAKGILSSGHIKAGIGQSATTAQTKLPTVSVTRDWSYAVGDTDTQLGGKNHDVIFVLDRQKIENNYKTIGTSQSDDTRSGAFSGMRPGKRDAIRSISPGGEEYRTIDTDNDRTISQAERDAFKQKHTDAGTLDKAQLLWQRIHDIKQSKAGGEFEEAIPVKNGQLPIQNIVIGIFLNSDAAKHDPELENHPLRVGGR